MTEESINKDNYYKEGWAISPELISHIKKIVPKKSSILELGSGYGSYILSEYAQMTCVEHDTEWIDSFPSIKYIYAPLINVDKKTKWYDPKILKKELSKVNYDLLLIDGPPRKNRRNFFKNMDLFSLNVPWAFDDANRKEILIGAIDIALKYNKKISPLRLKHDLDISKSKNPVKDVKKMLKKDFADKKKSHLILV